MQRTHGKVIGRTIGDKDEMFDVVSSEFFFDRFYQTIVKFFPSGFELGFVTWLA
jgi:hypothetical protein